MIIGLPLEMPPLLEGSSKEERVAIPSGLAQTQFRVEKEKEKEKLKH